MSELDKIINQQKIISKQEVLLMVIEDVTIHQRTRDKYQQKFNELNKEFEEIETIYNAECPELKELIK